MTNQPSCSINERHADDALSAAHHAPVYASLTSVVAEWAVSSRVTAFSTTRLGGVSKEPFDSLNLGLHVGDDREAVLENRRRLESSFVLPASPLWLNQTHGTDIEAFTSTSSSTIDEAGREHPVSAGPSSSGPHCADGAYTNQCDTVIAVLTADCLPVVIATADGAEIAVAHAGWRGLAAGVLENALAAFTPGKALHAWLGPAIGASAFEVGEEVLEAFMSRQSTHEAAFRQGMSSGKYWADLYALATAELQQASSVVVTGGNYCTFSQQDLFHSHRRDGVSSGRMATVAWIDPQG